MPRCTLTRVALLVTLGWTSPARAVDFFWVGGLGGGGNFRTAGNWTFTPPPFPLDPAPGGAGDTTNFDLGRDPEDRYTVTNVRGENSRLIVHDDSLTLDIPDSIVGVDYRLSNVSESSPSLTVGTGTGHTANVILQGDGLGSVLSTQSTVIGRTALSSGTLTADNLRWVGLGNLIVGESGTGTLTIQNGAVVSVDGAVGANIGFHSGSSGNVIVDGAGTAWNVSEVISVRSDSTLTIQNGATVSSRNGSSSDGAMIVDGPGAVWTMSDFLSIFFGTGTATLTIQNGGTVIVGSDGTGPLTGSSSSEVTLDSGGVLDVRDTMDMNTGLFNFLGGTLHVEEFDGNLVNQGGILAPGPFIGSTAVTGNYTHQSAATLQIGIAGTIPGALHDFVSVAGTALLAGELELALINSFEPDPDDEFVVFNTDSLLLGTISNVASGQRLATTDGLGSFLVHYGPTSTFNANRVVLTDFLPTLPGDYNDDGTVNAADYVLWRRNDGTQAGYDTWRDNFGQPAGSGSGLGATGSASATVPEPASFIIGLGIFLPASTMRRRRRFCRTAGAA